VIEVRSFPQAVMIVAAGHEVLRVVPLDDGGTAWFFSDGAQPAANLYQQAKSRLRALEAAARRSA
jgi:hypothetical protein